MDVSAFHWLASTTRPSGHKATRRCGKERHFAVLPYACQA